MPEDYLHSIKDSITRIIDAADVQNSHNDLIKELFSKIDPKFHEKHDTVVEMILFYLAKSLDKINTSDLDTTFMLLLDFLRTQHTINDKQLISRIVDLLNKLTTEFDLINHKSKYFFEFKYFFISKYSINSFYGNFLYKNPTQNTRYKYNGDILKNVTRNQRRNGSLVEKYNNAMSIFDEPAMTMMNTLHSEFNDSFDNGEDAISPNCKTIIHTITACMDAFRERIRHFKKFGILEPFNDTKTLSLSIKNFYKNLKLSDGLSDIQQKLGVDQLEFVANVEYSSKEDLKFLYEPVTENFNTEDLNFDMSLSLKDLTPENMALVSNSVVYVRFLITAFIIKLKVFLRYLQDFRTLFSDLYAILANNPSLVPPSAIKNLKLSLKSSVLRNSLHFLKTVLTREYKSFLHVINASENTSSLFIDTSMEFMLENCESNSYDFKDLHLTNTEFKELEKPGYTLPKPYVFNLQDHKQIEHEIDQEKISSENLNKKFDEMNELATSGPVDKTQDDWCAFNVLYKFAPANKNFEISSLKNFKNNNFDDVFSTVYKENSVKELKEKLQQELEGLSSKQDEIQLDINKIKEANKKINDMMYLPNTEFIQIYQTEFEISQDKDDSELETVSIEKHSCFKENSSESHVLVYKPYPKRVLTVDEDEDTFIDTKKQHEATQESSDKKPLRTSRRLQQLEGESTGDDTGKIQFLLPKKSYKEAALEDEEIEGGDVEDSKFNEAKKNLQLKEAELGGDVNDVEEEEASLKSEYDDICTENTKANNHSEVPDLKTLNKHKALDTDELKSIMKDHRPIKRQLETDESETENAEENKKVKLSE